MSTKKGSPWLVSWFSVAALILFFSSSAEAKVWTVSIRNSRSFSPKNIVINSGDTVKWVWQVNGHDVVSGSSGKYNRIFRKRQLGRRGDVFQVKFTSEFLARHPVRNNLYKYFCTPHWKDGMVGTIQVTQ